MKASTASAPLAPAVSMEMSAPPARPTPAPEPEPSDLDVLLKPDFTPKPAEPVKEPDPAPDAASSEPKKSEPEPPKKSAKDEEFDKFLKGEEKPKEESKPEPVAEKAEQNSEFKTPKALRDAYESTKAEKQRLATELESLRKSQSDAKALLKEIEDLKKHNSEMEDTFRAHKYENSQEYREKFLQPMEKLYANAVNTLSELEVEDPEKGSRQATPQDLETIVRLPVGKAIAAAKTLFGDASAIVLSYREQIKSLYQQSEEAREHHKKHWSELEQKTRAEQLAHKETLESLWNKTNEELSQKYADVFGELDGDEEGNKLITKGRQLADIALRGSENLPLEQRIRVAAEIRNRAAAFGREVVRRKKAESEIASLKEKLKAYEQSSPDKGSPKPAKSKETASPNNLEEALAALGSLA